MLSVKPWKLDAMARLFLSVFLCIYAGSLAVSALHYSGVGKAAWRFYPLAAAALGCLGATFVLLRRPWRLEHIMRHLAAVLVCFYAALFLGAWAQKMAGPPGTSVGQMILAALSFQGAALILIDRFLHEHHTTWTAAFGFSKNRQQAVMLGAIVACLFLPIGWGLQWVSANMLLPHLHLKPEEQQAVRALQMADTWAARLVFGLLTILLVPPAEEALFRGILYPWIKQAGFPRLALWGTSLLFAAVHLNLAIFLPLTALALALAILYERTDNLLAPITAHALFNALNFTLLYLGPEIAELRGPN